MKYIACLLLILPSLGFSEDAGPFRSFLDNYELGLHIDVGKTVLDHDNASVIGLGIHGRRHVNQRHTRGWQFGLNHFREQELQTTVPEYEALYGTVNWEWRLGREKLKRFPLHIGVGLGLALAEENPLLGCEVQAATYAWLRLGKRFQLMFGHYSDLDTCRGRGQNWVPMRLNLFSG